MSNSKLLKSNRGGEILWLDGYLYHLNKKTDEKWYWRCIKQRSSKCGVTVTTTVHDGKHSVVNQSHSHGHAPSPEKESELNLRESLKKRANDCMDNPSQIIQRCIQDIPSTSAPHLPNANAMRMVIQRKRNKDLPKQPSTVHDVDIPDHYATIGCHSADGSRPEREIFLIGNYKEGDESVLVFSTKENLKYLRDAVFWLMDGTFSCCPDPYAQIYSIHAQVGTEDEVHKILPLVYGLLSHKTRNCYKVFLEIVKSFAINNCNMILDPDIIITDFELAAICAAKDVFPDCEHKLCFFHLTQSIWRHIVSAGLANEYGRDSVFAHKLRQIAALAFLEPKEIPKAFKILKRDVLPKKAKEVMKWFSKYYIKTKLRSRRSTGNKVAIKNKPPRFPPKMWTVSDRFSASIPMTQNALESWHNRWNTLLSRRKWNLYKTISEFQKEQKNTRDLIERINSNEPMPKRSRGTCNAERLREQMKKKKKVDLKTFLSGIAHICYLKT